MRPALYPVLFRRPLRGGPDLDLNFTSGTLDSRVTYTGASLSTLTDATGAIAYKPHNLLTYSEQFDNAGWAKLGATVSANQTIAPTGSSTADLLVESATSAPHFAYYSLGGTSSGVDYTLSVKLKAAGRSWVALRCGKRARFNLSTGVIGTVESGGAASIVSEGNGWYTCSVKGQFGFSGTNEFYVMLADNDGAADPSYTGDGTSGVYVWGTQLNVGPLQPYYPTTSAAYYGPRFTYDPVTHAALGLLIEEQRTNLLLNSEYFSAASWNGGSVTVALAAGTAPNGATTLNKLTANSTANTSHQRYQIGLTLVSGNKYTGCAWMRQAEYSVGIINIYDTTTGNCQTYFNLATGAVMTLGAGCTATCTAYPGGIYLCTVTRTVAAASGGLSVEFSNADNTPAFAAAVGSGIYAWGAQLEAGAFATSYIPTTSASVTRAADSATMTGSNFSSWFNATQGTFVVDWTTAKTSRAIIISDGSFSNYLEVLRLNTFSAGAYVGPSTGDSVVGSGAYASGQFAAGESLKSAASYSATALIAAQRGSSTTAAAPTFTGINSLRIGVDSPNVTAVVGSHTISRIRYYNTALTNAQLQALTT